MSATRLRRFVTEHRSAGSAVLSSSNAAGAGILAKSYSLPSTAAPSGHIAWDDAKATHATILPTFPGQPESVTQFVSGVSAPFVAEFSGVFVLGDTGAFPLALQCAGWCQLFIYGARLFAVFSLPAGASSILSCPEI